ncbi:MAG TPA: hypothetical protein VD966_08310 [Pyrinomonadaceae bacterium]|nr:hypothetical protein [Pyrinomonadaceae bacterium]
MNTQSPTYQIIAICLRIALVLGLVWAGWSIYRKLPGGRLATVGGSHAISITSLLIVLRPATDETHAAMDIPVELYPVDLAAVRREYFDPDNYRSERRAGMRFGDFLERRMDGRAPVTTRLDRQGQATVRVTPGKWWIHATLVGAQNMEWRLPVNVAGRQQVVELTSENAYARSKSF